MFGIVETCEMKARFGALFIFDEYKNDMNFIFFIFKYIVRMLALIKCLLMVLWIYTIFSFKKFEYRTALGHLVPVRLWHPQ